MAELSNTVFSVLIGVFNGYLLGSALRAADSHFKPKPQQANNTIHTVDTSGDIVVHVDHGFDVDFAMLGLSALFEPIRPKGCNSFVDLFKYLYQGADRLTRIKASFGSMVFSAGLAFGYYEKVGVEYAALFIATTYLATGYFRDNTDIGFYWNPVGVSSKKICEITGLNKLFVSKAQTVGGGDTPQSQKALRTAIINRYSGNAEGKQVG